MSEKDDKDERDIDAEIADLIARASEKKVIKRQTSIVKPADITRMPEIKKKVETMTKEGFSTAQIGVALGFDETKIAMLLEEPTEPESSEHMLQENLKRVYALVAIADATYRDDPKFNNALAVTGLIDSVTKIIGEIHALKEKEDVYAVIVQKCVQPIIRNMISDMMTEFRFLTKSLSDAPDKNDEHLQNAAMSIGKKFEENYRRATELLAQVIGLNADAKARVLARLALSGD